MRKLTPREKHWYGCEDCGDAIITGTQHNIIRCPHKKCAYEERFDRPWSRVEKAERNSYDPYYRKD